MSSQATINTLNRLLAILCRSFPQYLRHARPYIPSGYERAAETLDEIVADQDVLIERVTRMIDDTGSPADRGEFPMIFTDAHDVGVDFLVRRAIDYGRQDIADLQQCVDALNLAPAAKSLAEEALGMTRAHVDALEEATHRKSDDTTPANSGTGN